LKSKFIYDLCPVFGVHYRLVHDLLFKTLPRFENLPTILATLLSLLLLYLLANGTYYAFEKRFIARGHRRAYSRG
jgi:peptidoglycan/LPS O-acetylase OafA/YrhL